MKHSLIGLLTFLVSATTFGHGEDKPGPNGGYIQMPGAFHTEVVPNLQDGSLRVYLLDINWKNPVTKDSSVAVELKSTSIETFECLADSPESFTCRPAKKTQFKAGTLTVKAKRQNLEGTAQYALPFSRKKPSNSQGSGHHH